MCMTVDVIVGDGSNGRGFTLSSISALCRYGWWPDPEDFDQPGGTYMEGGVEKPYGSHQPGPNECLCSVNLETLLPRIGLPWSNEVFGYDVRVPVDQVPAPTGDFEATMAVLIQAEIGPKMSRMVLTPAADRALANHWVEVSGVDRLVLTDSGREWLDGWKAGLTDLPIDAVA